MILPAVMPALLLIGGVGPLGDPTRTASPPATPSAAATSAVAGGGHRARAPHTPGDPLESFNRKSFRTQQGFDRRFYRPVAFAFKHVVPGPIRTALRHFFSNLGEPIVFLNYVLQLKPGKAIETATRFAINSTLGLAGTVDVAKGPAIRLPHRPNGLGDTLGYYGVKPGPYLFLPFVGPTTLRDLFGNAADGAILAPTVGTPFDKLYYQLPRAVLPGLDQRVEADSDLHALMVGAVDPYATLRSVYLQDRASEIRQLHRPGYNARTSLELGDPLADPAGVSAADKGGVPELADPMVDPAAPPAPPATPATAPASPKAQPASPNAAGAPELDDPLKDPAAKPPS